MLQSSQAQNQRNLYSLHTMNVLLKHQRTVRHSTRGVCISFTLWTFYWSIRGQSVTEPEEFLLPSYYERSIETSEGSQAPNQRNLYSLHIMNFLLKHQRAIRHRTRGICTHFTLWTFYWNIRGQSGTEAEEFVLTSHSERSIEISDGSQAQNQRNLYSLHIMNVLLKLQRAVRHRTRGICTPFTLWTFYWNMTGQSGTEPEEFAVVSQENLFYWNANKTN
jgi:hypothetical protein